MIDLRQTPQYAKYMTSIGWKVDKINDTYAYIKKFPLIGNFIKIQRPEKIDFNKIHNLVFKHKPWQIVVEPKYFSDVSHLTSQHFRQSRTYFVPSKTVQIDLTKSEKELLKEMHHKTRYNINLAKRLKLIVSSSKNIAQFANFWQDCAKKRGMFLSQKKEIIEIYKAFGKNAHITLISHSHTSRVDQVHTPRILSGVLLICSKDIGYYMYAGSTKEGKKLFAPTLAVWETITVAKRKGCKIFDFEGIYDSRFPLKSWMGFSRFKKSFGGKEITNPGTFNRTLLLGQFVNTI